MFSKHPKITDALLGRTQSPNAEDVMRDGIHDALKALLEESYLYRNRTIDLNPILKMADAKFSAAGLEDEFMHRPWVPFSRNRGFTHGERKLREHAVGGDPIGIPEKEMRLTFIIPTIKTWCAVCKSYELHDSIPHIETSPYHLNPEAIREAPGKQTMLFNFQCHRCKKAPLAFMVRREKNRLQLVGRSQPYFPEVPPEIPKGVRHIYADAIGAVACGDLAGGFYHLRTLLEHHMKATCGRKMEESIVGSTLCEEYNRQVDPIVAERAALTNPFDVCSISLHNRSGSLDEFERVRRQVIGHFRLISNLKELAPS